MKRYETLTTEAKKQISKILDFTLRYDIPYAYDCGEMSCDECPFHKRMTTCDEQGSEVRRTFGEWVEWLMEEI